MILFLTLGFLFSLSGIAKVSAGKKSMNHKNQKEHSNSDQKATLKKIGKDKLIVKVKGMVCAFCAQGITKNFNKQEQVKETKVDLDKMKVTVVLKKGKTLPEKIIKQVVTDAGFAYAGIKK